MTSLFSAFTSSSTSPAPQASSQPPSQSQRTTEAKQAFVAQLESEGAKLDSDLQARAKIIHSNAESLKKQDTNVQKETKELKKEGDVTEKGLKKIEQKSSGLSKETDSFEDEIARIEAELDTLDDAMDEVDRQDRGDDTGFESTSRDGRDDRLPHHIPLEHSDDEARSQTDASTRPRQPSIIVIPDEAHRLQQRLARISSRDESLHPSRDASPAKPD